MKRSVTVEVAGQRFTLKTDADESYVRELASYVNEKMGEAKSGSRTFSTHALAILAALHIADDLFQLRRRDGEMRRKVKEKSRALLGLIEKALTRSAGPR